MKIMPTAAAVAALAVFASIPTGASAGVYADDLGKCLVKSTTSSDRAVLVNWLFTVMSNHPSVTGLSKVSEAQANEFDKGITRLFERLMLVDCRKESIAAERYEGEQGTYGAFRVLGQSASREIMSHPAVEAKSMVFTDYLDESKWEAWVNEAKGDTPAASQAK